MDSFRGFEDEAAVPAYADEEPAMERPPEIGVDERRMHVRAYNYWVSLLDGRTYPLIQDLDPANIEDFGPHSILLDFSHDPGDPEITFMGAALKEECGLESGVRRISQIPPRSVLSRLTDHYMQIIANRAPIGFEAEFLGNRGHETLYRGILMPLSADGETIDFIYGVINWKELADSGTSAALGAQVDRAIAASPATAECPVWADGPNADFTEVTPEPAEPRDELTLSLWPDGDEEADLGEDAALADRLSLARASAEIASASDQRSRAALYRALGHAWDFALSALAEPEACAELLEDAGIKVQARAPMTPLVKLVFGAGYDKGRITEFAAALAWAKRHEVPRGGLAACLEGFEGGLKAMVLAERRARRPEPSPDRAEQDRARLRSAPPIARVEVQTPSHSEFVLLVARREAGGLAILAPVDDEKLTERAIRKAVGEPG